MIQIVVDALEKISKGLERELELLDIGIKIETIQIIEETRKPVETCCLSNSSERPSANAGVRKKNSNNKTQQNSRCRLCDDGDKTINPVISECCKLA